MLQQGGNYEMQYGKVLCTFELHAHSYFRKHTHTRTLALNLSYYNRTTEMKLRTYFHVKGFSFL